MPNKSIISKLDKLGEKHNCELCLPPFNESNNPFFKIDKLKDDAIAFHGFITDLDKVNVKFKFATVNKKREYVEILIGEK